MFSKIPENLEEELNESLKSNDKSEIIFAQ